MPSWQDPRDQEPMVEVGAEKNSTIFFPIPVDIINSLTQAVGKK